MQDNNVWKALISILQSPTTDDDLKKSTLCVVCNLSLVFSPSKDNLVGSGIIAVLAKFVMSSDSDFQFNALWAMMNVAYQEDISVKVSCGFISIYSKVKV